MPETKKDWKDLALKALMTILLMFISWVAVEIRATGSETATDVKETAADVKKNGAEIVELSKLFDKNSWLDSLQQEDIKILKGKHGIE